MVYLVWASDSFGARFKRAGHETVKARYDKIEDAVAQGDHDLKLDRKPLRVEDEDGQVLHEWPTETE